MHPEKQWRFHPELPRTDPRMRAGGTCRPIVSCRWSARKWFAHAKPLVYRNTCGCQSCLFVTEPLWIVGPSVKPPGSGYFRQTVASGCSWSQRKRKTCSRLTRYTLAYSFLLIAADIDVQ